MRITQVKLKDITSKITKGTTPTTLGHRFTECGINFIKAESITPEGRIDESKFAFIDVETNEKLKRSKIEEGDILFSIAGMKLGKVAVVRKEHLPANTNQALAIIRVDRSKALPEYIHYYLLNPTYYKYVNSITAQAAQPNINLTQVADLPISLPDLPIQKKVVAILSAYDDLIENNLRRIKILEEMARTIYREWFVKFRFPGHEKVRMVDSPLGKIPEGWELVTLGSVADLTWGDTSVTKESYVEKGFDAYSASGLDGKLEYFDYERDGIVLSAIGANCGETWFAKGKWSCIKNTIRFWAIDPMVSTEYLFFATKGKDFWPKRGSAQPFISQGDASACLIMVPSLKIMESFSSFANSVLTEIYLLRKKNDILRQTRDLLLPKLISGEIDVSELVIKI